MSTISLFLVLILFVLQVHSIPSYFPNIHYDLSSIIHHVNGRGDDQVDRWAEVISWEPRAVIYHNFLSKDECEHVINIAKPHMKRSTIINSVTGEIKLDNWFRPGYITFLERGQDEIVGAIEKRIAELTFLPIDNGEEFQVFRYEVGHKLGIHYDYQNGEYVTDAGGPTAATIRIYLSDVEEGGEEVFPLAKENNTALACWDGKYTHGGKTGGLSVKPKMGDALLFWNTKPDGTMDFSSLYGGCPVVKGSKWTATKGIHMKEHKPWV